MTEMATPFSRSTRSLRADSFRPTLIALIVFIVLISVWLAWFFVARITIYETGQIVGLTREGAVEADFSLEASNRITQGQRAVIRPQGRMVDEVDVIPAIVSSVTTLSRGDQVRVSLYPLLDGQAPITFPDGLNGNIEIEVARVSPASLIMHVAARDSDVQPESRSP